MPFAFCIALAQTAPTLDRTAFTFTRYDLQLTITPAEHKLGATGKITLRNTSKQPQKNLALQISSSLNWESLEIAGRPAQYLTQPYTSDIDHTGELSEAIIVLPAQVAPGATVELSVRYSGTVEQNSARLERIGAPPEIRARQDWDRISPDYTALRGAGFVVWYPVAMPAASISHENDYSDTMAEWSAREQQASMDLRLCQPSEAPMRFVSSGVQTGLASGVETGLAPSPGASALVKNADGQTRQAASLLVCSTFRWSPLNLTAPSFALAPFESLDALPQFHIHYLAASAEAARTFAEIAKAVAPGVTDWFGPPRQPAGIVQLPDNSWSPYESGATLFGPLPASLSKQAVQSTEVVLAHQLTHASLPSPRPWIFEGAAHFAQALQRQRQNGRQAALQYMQEQLPLLDEAEKQNNAAGHRGPSLINATDDVYYRTKAMYCWWMLRDTVGDAALQKALAKYRSEDDRDPAYIQRLIEAEWRATPSPAAAGPGGAGAKSLDWFFNSWIFSDSGPPDFSISAVSPRQTVTGGYMVAITIENSGGAEAEVPVSLRSALSEAFSRIRVPAHGRATVRIQLGQYPVSATVNDGSVPETNFENNSFKVPPKPRS